MVTAKAATAGKGTFGVRPACFADGLSEILIERDCWKIPCHIKFSAHFSGKPFGQTKREVNR
jgi:hypothetical protein